MDYTSEVAQILQETVFPVALYQAGKNEILNSVSDSELTPLDYAFTEFSRRISQLSREKVEKGTRKMVDGVESFNRNRFLSNVKRSAGVDLTAIVTRGGVAEEIRNAEKVSFELIKTIGPSYSDKAKKIIADGLNSGVTRKSLEKKLLKLGGFKEQYEGTEQRRARVIARDQSQKFAKSVDTARQKKVGVKRFKWVSVADERVRDKHDDYNGKVFEYANPPNGELPGNAVECRCHAEPDLEGMLEAIEKGELI